MYKQINISPELLPFPNSLGNNGDDDIRGIKHGCAICQSFLDKGHCEPLPIAALLEETSKDEEMLDVCRASKHCMNLLEKFKSGTYMTKNDGGDGKDDITIGIMDGEYAIYEGKHRVCVAKRFKIDTIPVMLED